MKLLKKKQDNLADKGDMEYNLNKRKETNHKYGQYMQL